MSTQLLQEPKPVHISEPGGYKRPKNAPRSLFDPAS